ncbi:MAG: nicotinate-nucleotide adenylyltransferase [Planctomycetota bacterium]|nr:nicotinate-nucleotide adenylyltransferase [Planctomycetota bacterium]
MRLGLFGGTFDPVHYGHLILAELCREKCRLDEVWFLPTAVPPHKRDSELTPAETRIEMLELAVAGNEHFAVNRYEADRGGVNYTTNTLRHFREEMPAAELFFLMGADMLHDLPNWRESSLVCELATIVSVRRAGLPEPEFGNLSEVASDDRIEKFRRHQIEMPAIEISSTDIRQRVGHGLTIRYLTTPAVEQFILSRGLFAGK